MKRRSFTSAIVATAYAVSCLCFVTTVPTAAFGYYRCEEGSRLQCTWRKTAGRWHRICHCVPNRKSGSTDGFGGSYGHAEVHKRNVPTVRPSGVNPSKIDVHSMRIAPVPTPQVRPTTTLGR